MASLSLNIATVYYSSFLFWWTLSAWKGWGIWTTKNEDISLERRQLPSQSESFSTSLLVSASFTLLECSWVSSSWAYPTGHIQASTKLSLTTQGPVVCLQVQITADWMSQQDIEPRPPLEKQGHKIVPRLQCVLVYSLDSHLHQSWAIAYKQRPSNLIKAAPCYLTWLKWYIRTQ